MKELKDDAKYDITEQEREAFIRAIHDPETREKIIAILRAGELLP